MASGTDETKFAYRDDARFKALLDLIDEARRRFKSQWAGKIKPEDAKLIELAERAVTSIGMQLEGAYAEQPGLLDGIPTRKAVTTEWKDRKAATRAARSSRKSGSGKTPTDPLRS